MSNDTPNLIREAKERDRFERIIGGDRPLLSQELTKHIIVTKIDDTPVDDHYGSPWRLVIGSLMAAALIFVAIELWLMVARWL